MPNPKIVVAGCVTAWLEATEADCGDAHRLAAPAGPLVMRAEGSAALVHRFIARLGGESTMYGRVGVDPLGAFLRQELPEASLTEDPLTDTSYAFYGNLAAERSVRIEHHGSNKAFAPEDLTLADAPGTILHITDLTLLSGLRSNPKKLAHLLQLAKARGYITSVDFSVPRSGPPAEGLEWGHLLDAVLPYVDVFAPSAEALMFALNRDRHAKYCAESVGQKPWETMLEPNDLEFLLNTVLDLGPSIVGIRMGLRGFIVRTAASEKLPDLPIDRQAWGDQTFRSSAFRADRQHLAHAGDVCVAAFLLCLASGKNIKDAVELACGAAAFALEGDGSIDSVPPLNEIETRIRSGWQKYRK